jgi:hypothetical protein
MIRYQVPDEGVAEVTAAVSAAFDALASKRPEGVRYAYYRCAERPELVALLELDEGVDNPLPTIEAARALQATVARWSVGGPPTPEPLTVLGEYRRRR